MSRRHAPQETAPRVTVAAISSSNPSRPSVALSYARLLSLRSTTSRRRGGEASKLRARRWSGRDEFRRERLDFSSPMALFFGV